MSSANIIYRPLRDSSDGIEVTREGLRKLVARKAIDPEGFEYRYSDSDAWRPLATLLVPAQPQPSLAASASREARSANARSKAPERAQPSPVTVRQWWDNTPAIATVAGLLLTTTGLLGLWCGWFTTSNSNPGGAPVKTLEQAKEERRAADAGAAIAIKQAETARLAAEDRAAKTEKALADQQAKTLVSSKEQVAPQPKVTVEWVLGEYTIQPLGAKVKLDKDRNIEMLFFTKAKGSYDFGIGLLHGLPTLKGITFWLPVDSNTLNALVDAKLPNLEALAFSSDISASDFQVLATLPHLHRLALHSCKMNAASVKQLASMTSLRRLQVSHSNIGDQELGVIATMRDLEELSLWYTQVTDAGLRHVVALNKLQALQIVVASDAGLASIAGLSNLKALYLTSSKISDAGMRHISGLSNLELLVLCDTQVTDAGLQSLKPLKRLKELYTEYGPVTDQGVAAIRREMPSLTTVGQGGGPGLDIFQDSKLHR